MYPFQSKPKDDDVQQYPPMPIPFEGSVYTIPFLSSIMMSSAGPRYTYSLKFF